MAWTEQERALERVQKAHGSTGYTEDHGNYRLVGFKIGTHKVFAIGNTWQEAMESLERKVRW